MICLARGFDAQGDAAVRWVLAGLDDPHAAQVGNIGFACPVVLDEDAIRIGRVEEAADLGDQLDNVRDAARADVPLEARRRLVGLDWVAVEEAVAGEGQ